MARVIWAMKVDTKRSIQRRSVHPAVAVERRESWWELRKRKKLVKATETQWVFVGKEQHQITATTTIAILRSQSIHSFIHSYRNQQMGVDTNNQCSAMTMRLFAAFALATVCSALETSHVSRMVQSSVPDNVSSRLMIHVSITGGSSMPFCVQSKRGAAAIVTTEVLVGAEIATHSLQCLSSLCDPTRFPGKKEQSSRKKMYNDLLCDFLMTLVASIFEINA